MSAIVVVAGKAFVFKGKLVQINDTEIILHSEYIGEALNIYAKDLIRDILFQNYSGQTIIIKALDGEPLQDMGVVQFVSDLCNEFSIPKTSVKFITHDNSDYMGFEKEVKYLEIFWSAHKFTSLNVKLNSDAKLFGIAVGRYSPPRLRTMFLLHKEFPNDSFIICQNKQNFNEGLLSTVKHLYSEEINWQNNYKFEQDLNQSFVSYKTSYKNYHNIWGNFKIEFVCETHANSKYWFTEKTARCLITGKPFVLLAGPNTLARLHDMGFRTFGSVIDESYDRAQSWPQRLERIIHTLKELKNRTDLDQAINQMYSIGKFNQQHYLNHVQS